MHDDTARALEAINRAFYRERAAEFDARRDAPWNGWRRVLRHVRSLENASPVRVLDVGCGNARLGAFLAHELGPEGVRLDYVGVDASAPLLAVARRRAPPEPHAWSLLERDFGDAPDEVLPPGPFELVALFGVLHGVPARARRRRLLAAAAARLAPGGILALTCWRFGELERYRCRFVSWATWNDAASVPIDPDELEPGDHLLPWGEDADSMRYCHAMTPEELAQLVEALPLEPVDAYRADGRDDDQNRYAIFRRR
jgi:SAM-dependent methyltransferase